MMNLTQIRKYSPQIKTIAKKHGVSCIYVFGSVARGKSSSQSDIDFLVDMEIGASLFGMAGFCYEVEKILGVPVDVIPSSILLHMKDQEFIKNIQRDAIAL